MSRLEGAAAAPPLVGEYDTLPEAMDAAANQFGDRDAFVEGPFV